MCVYKSLTPLINMKNTLKNTLLSIVIIAAPLASFAAEEESSKKAYNLPTYTIEDIASLPEPTKNPIPTVKAKYVGLNLKVKFTVSASGRPENVRLEKPLISYSDVDKMTFASQMQNRVKKWKFEPAIDKAGNPIAVKVIMPVQVIKKGANYSAVASLVLDTPNREET